MLFFYSYGPQNPFEAKVLVPWLGWSPFSASEASFHNLALFSVPCENDILAAFAICAAHFLFSFSNVKAPVPAVYCLPHLRATLGNIHFLHCKEEVTGFLHTPVPDARSSAADNLLLIISCFVSSSWTPLLSRSTSPRRRRRGPAAFPGLGKFF